MVVAGVVAVATSGAAITNAKSRGISSTERGLALKHLGVDTGMAVDRTAAAGAADVFEIENNSKGSLEITVTARPWTQSSSGVASPNRRRELSGVTLSDSTFTLDRGEKKQVQVTLRDAKSMYGALEIVGLPSNFKKRKGVVAGYRLVSALRYNPSEPKYSLKARSAKLRGKGRDRALSLTVRNSGNTVEPITGKVRLKSALGTRNRSISSVRILPRKTVAIPLVPARGLRAGTYTAEVTLMQGKNKTKIKKKIRIKR
jgi:hypothetical protein